MFDQPFFFHEFSCLVACNYEFVLYGALKVILCHEDGSVHVTFSAFDLRPKFSQSVHVESIRITPGLDVFYERIKTLDE